MKLYLCLLAVGALTLGGCCCGAETTARQAGPAADARQVFISMTSVRVPEAGVAAEIGKDASGKARRLTQDEAEAMIARWHASDTALVVSAPKILALHGQAATIFVGESIRFARSEAVTNEKGGLDFRIENDDRAVNLGEQMRVTPVVSQDAKTLTLDLDATWREQKNTYDIEQVSRMGATAFERDGVNTWAIRRAFRMPVGAYVLLGNAEMVDGNNGPSRQFVILHARVVTPDEAIGTKVGDS